MDDFFDFERYLLAPERNREIFHTQIAPTLLRNISAQDQPKAIFIACQPGGGKSTFCSSLRRKFDDIGGVAVLTGDTYKPFHDRYAEIIAGDDPRASSYFSLDARKWLAQAQDYVMKHKVHVIYETLMRDEADYIERVKRFKEVGYQIETVILAVPEILSKLGMIWRFYEDEERARTHGGPGGRIPLWSTHDTTLNKILETADWIDTNPFVDRLTICDRSGKELHVNHRQTDGTWKNAVSTREEIEGARKMEWAITEKEWFQTVSDILLKSQVAEMFRQDIIKLKELFDREV